MSKSDPIRGTTWTQTEIEHLWLHYSRFPVSFIAKQLKRSELACRVRMWRLRNSEDGERLRNVSQFALSAHGSP